MNAIDKKRSQLKQNAVNFLLNEIYDGNDILCPSYISVMITARDKKESPINYENDLKSFKALFNAGEEKYRIALWNSLVYSFNNTTKFCVRDFSTEEFAFIKSAIRASDHPMYEENVNDPIETDRLVMRKMTKDDCKLLAYHLKHDGDFMIFTGYPTTKKWVQRYANRLAPTFFTIVEKSTSEVVGYIGINVFELSATGLLEYYIFKEYRKRGYCKEAINKLVNMTLNNKIYEPIETVQACIYKRKVLKLNAVRARISIVNTASINTVESCGLICEAAIHKTIFIKDIGWTDEKVYYITKEMLHEKSI